MKNITKYILAAMAATAVLANAFEKPLTAFAWGDSDGGRETCSLQEINEGALGDKITFNSIIISDTDNDWYKGQTGNDIPKGTFRNELNFVGARENTGVNAGVNNIWNGNDITVEDGKTYIIRLYVHNNGPNGEDGMAKDTHVAIDVPGISSTQIEVNGLITSSNATPARYWDYVNFNSEVPFHLEYIYGSALLENGGIGTGSGLKLSDDIVKAESGGILIGYDALDGNVPGGYEYVNYITIEVKAVFDYEFATETKVRLAGDEEWQDAVEAKVGDKVEFQITYQNTSGSIQNNVKVRNILPSNLHYIVGSTKLKNSEYPDGCNITDGQPSDILNVINIGHYAPSANAKIMFTAEVVDDNLAEGRNTLVTWGQVGVGDKTLQDNAKVMVQNDTRFWKTVSILSALIVGFIVAIGIMLYKIRKRN